MAEIKRLSEVYISNGSGNKKLVYPGDKVQLIPPEPDDSDSLARRIKLTDFAFLRDWLGDGPFTISWIGRWPCGRILLYLKGAKTDEPGAFASDFYAET